MHPPSCSGMWIVGGIVIGGSLFIAQYLELRVTLPRYRYPVLGYSMFLGFFAVAWGAWLSNEWGHLNLLNYGLLPWVILSFYPIIRRSLTRERAPIVTALLRDPPHRRRSDQSAEPHEDPAVTRQWHGRPAVWDPWRSPEHCSTVSSPRSVSSGSDCSPLP